MHEKLDFIELKMSGALPSPKGVALRVNQLCQQETLSLKDLAQTIQADPALAGRILKLANYVNPNRSRPIAAITTDTLILIGIHAVRHVVLGLSLISNYRDGRCKAFDYENFWSRAVAMGSAAHAISSVIRIAAPAEMFNCGLMSGVGQLALVTVRPEEYCELLNRLPDDSSQSLQEAEKKNFGLSQREMLMFMLQDWGMPKLFIDALYYHEDPLASGYAEHSRPMRITCTLQLASLLASNCIEGDANEARLTRIRALGELLEIPPEQLDMITEQTTRDWVSWCQLLEIRARRKPARSAGALAPLALVDAEAAAAAGPVPVQLSPAAEPLQIMLASANEPQSNTLNKLLTAAGHRVTRVNDGRRALELVGQDRQHVLIADWMLPGLDGLSLCRELRKTRHGQQIYCMLLSPFEDERRLVDAYEAGVDGFMRAPPNLRLLSAQLLAAQRFAWMRAEADGLDQP